MRSPETKPSSGTRGSGEHMSPLPPPGVLVRATASRCAHRRSTRYHSSA